MPLATDSSSGDSLQPVATETEAKRAQPIVEKRIIIHPLMRKMFCKLDANVYPAMNHLRESRQRADVDLGQLLRCKRSTDSKSVICLSIGRIDDVAVLDAVRQQVVDITAAANHRTFVGYR